MMGHFSKKFMIKVLPMSLLALTLAYTANADRVKHRRPSPSDGGKPKMGSRDRLPITVKTFDDYLKHEVKWQSRRLPELTDEDRKIFEETLLSMFQQEKIKQEKETNKYLKKSAHQTYNDEKKWQQERMKWVQKWKAEMEKRDPVEAEEFFARQTKPIVLKIETVNINKEFPKSLSDYRKRENDKKTAQQALAKAGIYPDSYIDPKEMSTDKQYEIIKKVYKGLIRDKKLHYAKEIEERFVTDSAVTSPADGWIKELAIDKLINFDFGDYELHDKGDLASNLITNSFDKISESLVNEYSYKIELKEEENIEKAKNKSSFRGSLPGGYHKLKPKVGSIE